MPRLPFALLLLAPLTFADEPKKEEPKESGPFYQSWAKYKPGTSVALKMKQTGGEKAMESGGTYTLAEVNKDGTLVLEVEYNRSTDGKAEKPEKSKTKVGKADEWVYPIPLDPKTGKPKDVVDEGTEKLKAGGTEYECKWYKIEPKLPDGSKVEGKLWVCDDFPGRLVKMNGKSPTGDFSVAITDVTIKK